ncbi:unnamed protein product [Rhizophagus irregularis]|nr:unnamed protein product [Rhizophagus irregularis]
MYAKRIIASGWKKVNVCDRTENIDKVVAEYGPSTKLDAIVAGQTSVKEPEIRAFEKHLPGDVHIISCHSLHGPTVDPKGQPLVMIQHRAADEKFDIAMRVLSCMESEFVKLSYKEHDRITADTQAVTHLAFLSMGTRGKRNVNFHGKRHNITRVKKAGEFVFEKRKPNSHLSLLAMTDCWYTLEINPYEHMVCQTPLFRLWTGITEYLFRNTDMLEAAIHSALYSSKIPQNSLNQGLMKVTKLEER